MNLVDAKDEQDFIDRVKQWDKWFCDSWEASHKGTPLGFHDLTRDDRVFRAWFEQQMTENPNYLLMLTTPSIAPDGGPLVRRYMKLIGEGGQGIDWRHFAIALATRVSRAKGVMFALSQQMAPQQPQAPQPGQQPGQENATPLAGGGFSPPAPPAVAPLPTPNTMTMPQGVA